VHGSPTDQKSALADQHGVSGHGQLPFPAWPLRNGLAFPPPPPPPQTAEIEASSRWAPLPRSAWPHEGFKKP